MHRRSTHLKSTDGQSSSNSHSALMHSFSKHNKFVLIESKMQSSLPPHGLGTHNPDLQIIPLSQLRDLSHVVCLIQLPLILQISYFEQSLDDLHEQIPKISHISWQSSLMQISLGFLHPWSFLHEDVIILLGMHTPWEQNMSFGQYPQRSGLQMPPRHW